MIKVSSAEIDIDVEKYAQRISERGYVLYDREALLEAKREMANKRLVYELMAIDKMMQISWCSLGSLSRDVVLNYLKKFEFCPARFFRCKGVKGESLNMKNCLQPLKENGYAEEFLEYYMNFSSLKSKVNSITTLSDLCCQPFKEGDKEVVNEHGKVLYQVPCHPSEQVNRRFNYKNFDIIAQFPKKETAHCISVEEGFVLAWGDFAQSDFRIAYNLFMRTSENDAVMAKCEDKYEGLARIVNQKFGQPFNQEKFVEERPLYKTLTLATVYGKRDSTTKKEAAFIKKFANFLEGCPKYVEFRDRVLQTLELKPAVIAVESYFGSEQAINATWNTDSIDNLLEKTLNCPIQTGTSEMVIFATNKLLDTFYEQGWSEEDVSLYYVRHDEIVLKIRKEALKDAWILKQWEQIFVDDWTPLSVVFELGYNYGRVDEQLMKEYEQGIVKNHEKLQTFSLSSDGGREDFCPVLSVAMMEVGFVYLDKRGETILVFYQEGEKRVDWTPVSSTFEGDLVQMIQQYTRTLELGEVRGVIVRNFFVEDFVFEEELGLPVRFAKTEFAGISHAMALAKWVTCLYCKKFNEESPTNPPTKEWENFVKSKELRGVKILELQDSDQGSSEDEEDGIFPF